MISKLRSKLNSVIIDLNQSIKQSEFSVTIQSSSPSCVLINCVTLDMSLNLSGSLFPYPHNIGVGLENF